MLCLCGADVPCVALRVFHACGPAKFVACIYAKLARSLPGTSTAVAALQVLRAAAGSGVHIDKVHVVLSRPFFISFAAF